MSRKLYALGILIGAIGFLVLTYLYFFVYYTATVVIQANVAGYKVEFFSKSTAQKWEYNCPEKECFIRDVSPFEYNISFLKANYETQIIPMKVRARKTEELYIKMTKKANLQLLEDENIQESPKNRIQRLREQNRYYAVFQVQKDKKIIFTEQGDILEMSMIDVQKKTKTKIKNFPKVPKSEIHAQSIASSSDIFLSLSGSHYLYLKDTGKIQKLPYTFPILYLKGGTQDGQYLIVTEKGTFLYDVRTQTSEFQYLFKDFVYYDDTLIGVIYKDELQKKKNFNLSATQNLIMQYHLATKERKVLLKTSLEIDRIEKKGENIIFFVGDDAYELENF